MISSNLPKTSFSSKMPHFQWNGDETCVFSQDGMLRVLGSSSKKKHDKAVSDNMMSITMFRCGNAAGTQGPVLFLAKGKKDSSIPRSLGPRSLCSTHKLPQGSRVIMSDNAYMDDKAWLKAVEFIAPGIRKAPVSFFLFLFIRMPLALGFEICV